MHFEADNNAFELSLPAMLHRDACMFPLRPCICYHPRNKRPSLQQILRPYHLNRVYRVYRFYKV